MPHVIKLKDGRLITPFTLEDVLDEISSVMGNEVREYIEEWKADVDDDREADRYDREEAEKELEQVKDHNHSFICDIREEVEALEDFLAAERMDRKKIQKTVRNINQMLYREL